MNRNVVASRRAPAAPRDEGFNLVELVVAMVILGIVLVLMAGVQISAAVSVTEARKVQQATAFANEAVEQMRSIPWNTLSKGMYSGFLTAAGGDSLVVSGQLRVDGKSPNLIVAPTSNDQNLTKPARPLFDAYGSNKQIRQDPSLAGVLFTIKAYVTEPLTGAGDAVAGIAVVVEWPDRRGKISRTTVWSEAYRGSATSCGNADTQPFLAACQAFFEATSGTGSLSIDVSAVNLAAAPGDTTPWPLLVPQPTDAYSLGMRSAIVSASISSQQVNLADAILQYGGTTLDDALASTAALDVGYAIYPLRASDDVTNPSGWVGNPTDLAITQNAAAEGERILQDEASKLGLRARSDYARAGTADASMTISCKPGIPVNAPCARAYLANGSDLNSGSGYLWLTLDDATVIRVSRRIVDGIPSTSGNTDEAWAARYTTAIGTAAVGCTSVSGPGCIAAGATRTMAPLSIGWVVGGGGWSGQASSDGMAILEGSSACPYRSPNGTYYYQDSVMVQRGASQTTTLPTVTRCGQIRYWNGTGYTPVAITTAGHATIDTAPVTWSKDGYTIVGTTQIQIAGVVNPNTAPTDPACKTAACFATVSAGSITFVSSYHITWGSGEQLLIVVTKVDGPSASASYKAAPSAS